MTVRLKICGIVCSEDLELCAELGVDAVGINFWSGSKRGVSVAAAERMLADAAATGLQRVGVFVDQTPNEVLAIARQLQLDAVQLHGDGPVEPFAALGVPYVWVLRGTPTLEGLRVPTPAPAWVLLDAHVAGYGGAGERTDWGWAARAVAHLAPLPVWLAGGISPSNAAQARQQVAPAGLDVASGAERDTARVGAGASPGRKDRAAVAALVRACHQSPA